MEAKFLYECWYHRTVISHIKLKLGLMGVENIPRLFFFPVSVRTQFWLEQIRDRIAIQFKESFLKFHHLNNFNMRCLRRFLHRTLIIYLKLIIMRLHLCVEFLSKKLNYFSQYLIIYIFLGDSNVHLILRYILVISH